MKNKAKINKNKKNKTDGEISLSFCGLKSDESQEDKVIEYMEKMRKGMPEILENETNSEELSFCGLKSKQGKLKMRSKFNIKKQALTHLETVKKEKRKKKALKRLKELQKEKLAARREIKPKQEKKKLDLEEIKLNRIINKYQPELTTIHSRKKWYED